MLWVENVQDRARSRLFLAASSSSTVMFQTGRAASVAGVAVAWASSFSAARVSASEVAPRGKGTGLGDQRYGRWR